MIARIEFTYASQEKLVELAKDELVYEQLRAILTNAPAPDNRDKSYYWERECLVDLASDGPTLIALGLTFEVKNFKGTMTLKALLPEGRGDYKVFVQVPHIGLLAIDEVEVEEDCCTDKLQTRLDQGWRILCVCPPNAARRPDYILGRTKERS